MIKKQWLVILIMSIASNIFLMGNVFAATESSVEVNDLLININRDLGTTEETYTVTASDSLKSFKLFFSDDNNIEVTSTGESSWDISVKYKGNSYSTTSSSSTIGINGKTISMDIISSKEMAFTIDKDLSDSFFNKILDNHAAFTLNAESVAGKKINVERTSVSGGNDRYAFSSNNELSSARVVDGTDNIAITRNGSNYDVSGQYKGTTGSTSVAVGGTTLISYGDIEVAIEVSADAKTITLDTDPTVVQELIQKLLDEKRNITEIIIDSSIFEIPSNSNISKIEIPTGISDPKIKFTVSGNETLTNKEITIDDSLNTGMTVVFPAGTTITGPAGWDGTIELPRVSTATLEISGYTTAIDSVVEIGLSGNSLTFDQPVRLTFPGKAGKRIGFMVGGVFTEITTVCSDSLPAGATECKGTSGADAFVLTKHFTKFIAYTQNVNVVSGGGGGGGGGYDVTSPVISDIKIVATTSNTAVITWKTNESSPSWIVYGVSTNYGQEVKITTYSNSHSITLSNLLPATTYHYQIKSADSSNNASASVDMSFATLALEKIESIKVVPIIEDKKVDIIEEDVFVGSSSTTGNYTINSAPVVTSTPESTSTEQIIQPEPETTEPIQTTDEPTSSINPEQASLVSTGFNFSNYLWIGLILILVIIGGIYFVKKTKK
jgi:LPXTG-motif cell wall-anchored protein